MICGRDGFLVSLIFISKSHFAVFFPTSTAPFRSWVGRQTFEMRTFTSSRRQDPLFSFRTSIRKRRVWIWVSRNIPVAQCTKARRRLVRANGQCLLVLASNECCFIYLTSGIALSWKLLGNSDPMDQIRCRQ